MGFPEGTSIPKPCLLPGNSQRESSGRLEQSSDLKMQVQAVGRESTLGDSVHENDKGIKWTSTLSMITSQVSLPTLVSLP